MNNDYLALERDNDLAVVWIDQADAKVNTISPGALEAIGGVLDVVEQDDEIKAVVFISRKKTPSSPGPTSGCSKR